MLSGPGLSRGRAMPANHEVGGVWSHEGGEVALRARSDAAGRRSVNHANDETEPGRTAPLSDEELMTRFYAGIDSAWEELERRHRNRLLRCARVRCGELAWDAVQETFLRVVRARDGGGSWVSGKGTVRCWLNRILANCITDMFRKEQRHGTPLSLSPDPEESSVPVPSPA